ncbi:hypothetical protein ACFXPA_48660, partial [Amycolatopsis sp. NPDC059090]|uniref:hypothetical protein n=1 Tax=Amycolatopsis sp. NPDC059090 TaxID=3346723 RepID=UPI00366FDDA4
MRRVIPVTGDSAAVAAAHCASSCEPHILYENGGTVSWPRVNAPWSRLVRDACGCAWAGGIAAPRGPLPAIGAALRAGATENQAYGWLAAELFESAVEEYSRTLLSAAAGNRLRARGAVLSADSVGELDDLAQQVGSAERKAAGPSPSERIPPGGSHGHEPVGDRPTVPVTNGDAAIAESRFDHLDRRINWIGEVS